MTPGIFIQINTVAFSKDCRHFPFPSGTPGGIVVARRSKLHQPADEAAGDGARQQNLKFKVLIPVNNTI
ncbi:hypothetical protein MgSA37_01376 [Mucilaginibacter gotjawali]|uniref:Uncharacterized protein n=2 Tax=Mucilaginibacter gotjawali TaxID=1550579 RepID=A0A839SDX7_9SPHI|nr:hypothetical protein [Mucilaginibacter gotjawali]BAU53209.1 hypothetical protein MgSA37_01376 [Mucilaginibacter gotjawali]